MIIVNSDYLKISKEERQKHLRVDEDCCERGGNSTNHRGVLAQFLNTSIPGHNVILAHACNNSNCSNPHHLYWASHYENTVEDGSKFGTWKNPWERSVEKYGYEEACAIQSRSKKGNKNGSGNKGKPKSDEHKRKLSLNHKGGKPKGWRKNKSGSGEIGETQGT